MHLQAFLVPVWYLYLVILALATIGLILIGIPRKTVEDRVGTYSPRTLVMVPCRGLDYSLEDNLNSIMSQDYESFDVLAIVDDLEDPSLQVIKKLSIPFIVSDFKCVSCSGKTRALSTAMKERNDYDAYVICDSDILVKPDWLSRLVSPLEDEEIGLSTTFPHFAPVGGFWSKVKAVWGVVGQSLMESKLTRFGWGGSLAFRKSLLDDESFKYFSEAVSDDTALSDISKRKGLNISYSKGARPVINTPDDFHTFFEWANRQTALSISATRRVFHFGIIVYVSTILVFISAIILSILVSPLFTILFIPTVLSEFNNARRSRTLFPLIFLITPILPFLFLSNLLIANRMDRIQWRGNSYVLQKKS